MEIYSHPDIPEILTIEGNSMCCDCGVQKPKWASINNGIFLCLKCAGIHRSYGSEISVIRSLQIDSWTDNQILYLTKGGNNKFKLFLKEYNIDENSPMDLKYKSKASDYYRKYLKNDVESKTNPNYIPEDITKPDICMGTQIIEINKNTNNINNSNVISSASDKKDNNINKTSFFGFMGSILSVVKDRAVDAASSVSKGIEDLKLANKIKEAGNTVAEYAVTGGNFVVGQAQKAVNSELVQGVAKKAESGFNSVIEKTKVLLNEASPNEQNNQKNCDVKKGTDLDNEGVMSNVVKNENKPIDSNLEINNNQEKIEKKDEKPPEINVSNSQNIEEKSGGEEKTLSNENQNKSSNENKDETQGIPQKLVEEKNVKQELEQNP